MKHILKLNLLVFVLLFTATLPFPLYLLRHPAFWFEGFFTWLEQGICHAFGLDFNFQDHLYSDSPDLCVHTVFLIFITPALAWGIQKTFRPQAEVTNKVYLLSASWILAFFLVKYGFDKVFKLQFYAPEPNILHTPFGALDKDILYWSTIGKSYSYSVFSGVLEVLAGLLLLFRSTRKLGALLSFGVLLHVLMINFSFGIEVKLLSSFLLLLSLVILAWYRKELKAFFTGEKTIICRPEPEIPIHFRLKRLLRFSLVFFILLESTFLAFSTGNFNDDLAPRPKFHGAYQVRDYADRQLEETLGLEKEQTIRRIFIHRQAWFIVQTTDDQFIDFAFSYLPGTNAIRLRNKAKTELLFRKTGQKKEILIEFGDKNELHKLFLEKLPL